MSSLVMATASATHPYA